MGLDGEARAGGRADRAAEQDVVREDEVGGKPLAHGGRVQLDEALALRPRQVLQEPSLEPLVAIEHEDRQQPADVGPHDLGAPEVDLLGVRAPGEKTVTSCPARLHSRASARV